MHSKKTFEIICWWTFGRSSRWAVFCKKGALRSFTKFTGKHLWQILYLNKVAGLRSATLLKTRLWHRCFPVNFANILRTRFLTVQNCFCFFKNTTSNKINSNYLGNKLFLKNIYIIKDLAHWCGQRTGR